MSFLEFVFVLYGFLESEGEDIPVVLIFEFNKEQHILKINL